MHNQSIAEWQHTHIFGQDRIKSGEKRTLLVIFITGLMMAGEISTGILFGSMALTADGIHMGSHMLGLGITFFAYVYARKHAHDQRFSFGTGKVNALAGYTSAMVLIFIALFMAYESIKRMISPVEILYNQAIVVAVIGLAVNGISIFILGKNDHTHGYEDHEHGTHDHEDHSHDDRHPEHKQPGADHNLKAAYTHVLTDAMTSVLAIFALLIAKYLHLAWMDPLMGIVGAILVVRWSVGLIKGTTIVLLDHQISSDRRNKIVRALESFKDTKVTDLHVWSIGPGIYSSEVSLVTHYPDSPDIYKGLIPPETGVVHTTIEINHSPD